MDSVQERKGRSRLFYRLIVSISFVVFLAILYALRTMIIPATVGALLAYACLPLLRKLKKTGLPDALALLILLGAFVLGIMLVTDRVKHIIPDDIGKILLRVRIQYKIHEKYQDIVGDEQNFITQSVAKEIDPVFNDFVDILSLNVTERNQLMWHYQDNKGRDKLLERYFQYHQANLATSREQPHHVKRTTSPRQANNLATSRERPRPSNSNKLLPAKQQHSSKKNAISKDISA